MEKLQILFPEPQLMKLRALAKKQDRPVSELVRTAVDFWLTRQGEEVNDSVRESPPVYHCGEILTPAEHLRDLAYQGRM